MSDRRRCFKHLLFCCDLTPESVLLIISLVIWFLGFTLFANWITYFCYYTLAPTIILLILYNLAAILLFCGVLCCGRGCIAAVPWILFICLLTLVVYSILTYLGQKCICDNIKWAVKPSLSELVVSSEYFRLTFAAGINFVLTFYAMLLVADYLDEE